MQILFLFLSIGYHDKKNGNVLMGSTLPYLVIERGRIIFRNGTTSSFSASTTPTGKLYI